MKNQINKVIFKYLDDMDYSIIDRDTKLYFVDSKDSKYIYIRYDKNDGWCFIYYKLIEEISSFFSLGDPESEKVIGEWVDNKLQMRVIDTHNIKFTIPISLYDNTLQMRVTNTVRV
jgi:hypothetical protein